VSTESEGVTSGSRRSNGSYPASDGKGSVAADDDHRPSELPSVEERLREIVDQYPERMRTPVSTTHGRKLRDEALQDPETVTREIDTGAGDGEVVHETVSRGALPWIAVVEEFLRDYEGYRDRYLRMGRGQQGSPEREEFLVPMHNSFAPEYQETQYARLKALKRQCVGESAEDSPTDETVVGEYDEPVTVLLGLTASSTTAGDEPRPPVDHDREIREAWSGSDGVRRTLRYVLQDRLGLDSSEYVWWMQSEPHPGGGAASGYSHAHPVVLLDGAAVDGVEVDAETFRPVVAKHVSECEGAEWDAHAIGESVTVRDPGEISDIAGYVSEYLAVDPDEDLLERSAEYIMWAATQWATSTQKYSKSRTATAAIDADRCHQEFADSEARQDRDHGDRVARSSRPGVSWECAECGSEWGIEQSPETLVEARRDGAGAAEVQTGGDETVDSGVSLRERWPDARSAARVGSDTRDRVCDHADGSGRCPLCCPDGETVDSGVPIPDSASAPSAPFESESFERPAEWTAEAVVQASTGEETVLGSPGGTRYGEIVVEGVDALAPRFVTVDPERLRQSRPWESTPFDEDEIRSGEVPPPELIERQINEIHMGSPLTAKRWSDDWYSNRFEVDDSGGEPADSAYSTRVDVAVTAAKHPGWSPDEVLDAVGAPESLRPVVSEVRDGE